jgi:hypothetical protein
MELEKYLNKNFLLKDPVGRTILYSFIIILFIILSTFLILIPRTRAVLKARTNLVRMQNTYKQLQDKVNILYSWNWQDVEEKLKLANTAFPVRKDIYLVIYALQEPCRRNNFVIEEMSFNLGEIESETDSKESAPAPKAKVKTNLDKIKVEMEVLGRESDFIGLLGDLDEGLPLLSISELNYSSKTDQGELISARLSLELHLASASEEKVVLNEKFNTKQLDFTATELETFEKIESYYNKSKDFFERLAVYDQLDQTMFFEEDVENRNPFAPL